MAETSSSSTVGHSRRMGITYGQLLPGDLVLVSFCDSGSVDVHTQSFLIISVKRKYVIQHGKRRA